MPLEVYLLLTFFIGVLTTYLVLNNKYNKLYLSKEEVYSDFLPIKKVKENYTLNEVYSNLQNSLDILKEDFYEKQKEMENLIGLIATYEQKNKQLEYQMENQKKEIENLNLQFQMQFQNISNKILDESSNKFIALNKSNLENILKPLHEKIQHFEHQIDQKFLEETKDKAGLKKEIEQLRTLNQQLSSDAINLANALKGDNKLQGNWGELRLEMILEKAGLKENIHYEKQISLKDHAGQNKRPDFIIKLPDSQHIIVDSKVSLTAYEKYHNATNKTTKSIALRELEKSIKSHIKNLASKNYHKLNTINSPDFVLLFIAIEPALNVLLQHNSNLYNEALEKNIVIVTTSTLLATLNTIAFTWKQQNQKENVIEIAKQSGLLYDKLVTFVEDLIIIGTRIKQAQNSYDLAFHKLKGGKRHHETLIGRAEKIRALGANNSRKLPI